MSPLFTALADPNIDEKKDGDNVVQAEDVNRVRKLIGRVRSGRLEWEVQCFVNEMMKAGKHYVNDKGQLDRRDRNQLRRPVNKFRSTLRKLKNAVTFNDPIVDVLPYHGQEANVTKEELDVASWICLNEYKRNDFQGLIKDFVEMSALKTWALVSVVPNDDAGDGERLTTCQLYDSLDVFTDDLNMEKAQIVVISSLEDKDYLKSKGYKLKNVSEAVNSSHSMSKVRLDRFNGKRMLENKILIDQVFMLEYEEDEEGNVKKDAKPKVIHFVVSGEHAISEKKVLEGYECLNELFKVYWMERDKVNTYGTPWMTDVVPLQRSMNDASENSDTMLHAFSKARFKQKGQDTDNIQLLENKHMQLFRYEGNAPEVMEYPNPPQGLFQMMAVREQQIENMVGQVAPRTESQGGANSGRQQALIMAENQDNVKEPADNLERFLEDIFRAVLEIAAQNIRKTMRLYEPESFGGDGQYDVVGESVKEPDDAKQKKIVRVRAFKNVRVSMVPGSFFQLEQAKQDYMSLLPILNNLGMKTEAKALYTTFLRILNVGMSRGIARSIEAESKKESLKNADWEIAELEFLKMSNGEKVTATPEQDHEVHLQVKVPGLQTIIERAGTDNDAYWMLLQNVNQHWQMLQANKSGGSAARLPPEIEQAAAAEMAGPSQGPQLPPGGLPAALAMGKGQALPMP